MALLTVFPVDNIVLLAMIFKVSRLLYIYIYITNGFVQLATLKEVAAACSTANSG